MRILAWPACILLFATAVALAQPEEGLVLHYTFDEGAGEVVRDKSGHGFDGRIVHAQRSGVSNKAEWVKERDRKVLRFDGWTHVDVGTKPNALMGKSGTLETWCLPEEISGGLITWNNGPNWPDERLVLAFVTWQDSRLMAVTADGKESNGSGREPVEKGKWAHCAMTYDGDNLRLFVNGALVQTMPQKVSPDVTGIPLRIGAVDGLGEVYFMGRMAEARIYNRALSAEEIGRHFTEGVKKLGVDLKRPIGVTARFDAKRGELTALCDLTGTPDFPGRPELVVLLRDANKKVMQEKTAPIPPKADTLPLTFSTMTLTAGLYELSVAVKDAGTGKILAEPVIARWYLPEVGQLAGAPPGRKILNNLVTQLAVADNLTLKDYQEIAFVNPRKGWVFISTTVQADSRGIITVSVDAEKKDAAIVHRVAEKPTMETMRMLSAGEHMLRIWADPEAGAKLPTMGQLVVRAVPAMMYCGWPGSSYVAGYGEYGFKFLARDVLPNINTFVGGDQATWDADRDEWKRRGGQCLLEQPLPTLIAGVLKDVPHPLTGDYAYNYWTQSGGFLKDNMEGAVADEFSGGSSLDYLGYTEAVKRMAANPALKGKAVHMWCNDATMLPGLSREFARVVMESGYKLATEVYLSEPPTVDAARAMFDLRIRRDVERWEQVFPGFTRHAIFVLGVLSAPPESCNLNPEVDYKVFLDMQFRHLAASPECFGLWGVMIYKATYAEEEALRWCGRLFRHYCIEGNTDLLSERYGFTYNLRHIRNADFNEGLTGWQVDAAEAGSVTAGKMPGLHQLFGRYYGNKEGNSFLLMKRSGQKPNRVSQEIAGLQAGRCYSMKLFAADHQDLLQAKSEKKRMTLSANIGNVDMIADKSFISEVKGYHTTAQYAGKAPPFMSYARFVFRAKGPTARLVISDWSDPSAGSGQATPGGPVGQEILMNFIEVQPYLED